MLIARDLHFDDKGNLIGHCIYLDQPITEFIYAYNPKRNKFKVLKGEDFIALTSHGASVLKKAYKEYQKTGELPEIVSEQWHG